MAVKGVLLFSFSALFPNKQLNMNIQKCNFKAAELRSLQSCLLNNKVLLPRTEAGRLSHISMTLLCNPENKSVLLHY